ncbi:plasmid replication DNA-binding protein, partial [Klebsiella pneumoniae]|uniref:plasmid replication DNA-binding protein n=1 Tax=Klebsiella pneumoniae TaxID=573 RepID=UPI0038B69AB0
GGKNSLNRLIRCVCGKKIGPDPRNFNQRVSLGRNDLLIRTFLNSQNLTEVDLLKRQVDILEKQLNQAIQRENQSLERESFYQEQIEAMQRLLEAPKANMTTFTDQSFKQDIATDPRSELATNYDELTTPQQDNKRIPIPEHVEPEQKKRGFLSRFFLPYG